jgi:hypothetical protein
MVSYFEAFWITAGIIAIGKLFWMVVYEYRYEGAGEDYLRYGKKFVHNTYVSTLPKSIHQKDGRHRTNTLENERNKSK